MISISPRLLSELSFVTPHASSLLTPLRAQALEEALGTTQDINMLKINAHPESCAGAGHALAMEGQRDWVNVVKFVNDFGSTFF